MLIRNPSVVHQRQRLGLRHLHLIGGKRIGSPGMFIIRFSPCSLLQKKNIEYNKS